MQKRAPLWTISSIQYDIVGYRKPFLIFVPSSYLSPSFSSLSLISITDSSGRLKHVAISSTVNLLIFNKFSASFNFNSSTILCIFSHTFFTPSFFSFKYATLLEILKNFLCSDLSVLSHCWIILDTQHF